MATLVVASGLVKTFRADGVERPVLGGVSLTVDQGEWVAVVGPSARIEVLDTGTQDLSPLMTVLRLIAGVLLVMAGTNLLSTLLIASRESAGRIGVQLAVGFTPRQIKTQGAVAGGTLGVVAAAVGVPLGLWIFRAMSDAVSANVGVGPGWMPAPGVIPTVILVVLAVLVSGALGALAVARVTQRSASDLVRGE